MRTAKGVSAINSRARTKGAKSGRGATKIRFAPEERLSIEEILDDETGNGALLRFFHPLQRVGILRRDPRELAKNGSFTIIRCIGLTMWA